MKLYSGTTKRIFKKRVGKYGIESLNFGKTLKVGDLIYTCSGYNKRIKEVNPCYYNWKLSSKSWYISDFEIITEDGGRCFLRSCCDPPRTKQQITDYWKNMNSDWFKDCGLAVAARNGEEIVNENGELLVKE